MTIIESDEMSALCQRGGQTRRISVALVGAQAPGAHVLVHIDSAVRVLSAEEARLIDDALTGLEAATRGAAFEDLFADLIGREPRLPPHLIAGKD